MLEDHKEIFELWDKSCEALVLAYLPEEALCRDIEGAFYIPSSRGVAEAFGYSLRNILGKKDGGSNWRDSVEWKTIKNLEKLEPRILNGTRRIFDFSDSQTIFGNYLSLLSGDFAYFHQIGKGDMFRFLGNQRDKVQKEFNSYWNKNEKIQWENIHKYMREYTKKDFSKKEN